MASNHTVVARTIRQFVDANLTPEANARKFAVAARSYRDELIRRGQSPPQFRTFVDGREGAKEETTKPGGATIYSFNLIGRVVRRALEELRRFAPEKSGDLRDSFVVSVDGRPWTKSYEEIPTYADVVIVNVAPYARKVETGAMIMTVPKEMFERARQRLLAVFPSVFFNKTFVLLPASFSTGKFKTPYILKGQFHAPVFEAQRRKRADRLGIMFHRAGRSQERGQQLTYPALSFSLSR